MIQIKDQEVKNLISEMTFKEFQECLTILGDQEKEMIQRYMEVMQVLGVTEETLSQVTIDDLIPFVRTLGSDKFKKTAVPQVIQIGDVVYNIHKGGDYKISIKDLWQIEKHIKRTGKLDLMRSVAVCLKQEGISQDFVYNEGHIFEKIAHIEGENVSVFLPLIAHLTVELGEKILLLNAATDTI